MDQLADVKAKVKAWERAFRRDNGRAPTKDDIRRGGEISEQYALWRKLSKEAEKHKANGRENGKHKAEEKAPRHDDHNTTSDAAATEHGAVSRQAPSPSMLGVQGTPKRQRFDYVHASSPKQLKSLLESARKSMKKDTPRTQARRWLSGEVDSPVHRKREFRGRQDAEEELGETPIKGEAFAILDDEPKGRDLFPIFRRAAGEMGAVGRTDKEPANGKRKATEAEVSRKKARASLSDDEEMDEDELAPTTPPTVSPLASRSRPTGERVLELTDDEFDPEASPAVVTIIGTRRTVVRISSIFDDDMVIDQSDLSEEEEDVEEDEAEGVELVTDDPRSMLSLLSLRSPIGRASEHMANLRVRALLDPSCEAAIALRAKRRGQDVFACGETGFEEEYLEIGAEVEIEGDDDWESDAEGWKADGSDEEW
ncbi:hypothetical protein CcaverHIS002_0212540 [Cutaneotrichosporon cavernicola]|nr:hypothetical protein CcaverHIS002_0212540 [Cutaneotrichosporon cavernicola]